MPKQQINTPTQIILDGVMTYLYSRGYTDGTIKPYKSAYHKMKRFFEEKKATCYSSRNNELFLELMAEHHNEGAFSTNRLRTIRRFAFMADELYSKGSITLRTLPLHVKRQPLESYKLLLNEFESSVLKDSYTHRTIIEKKGDIASLMFYLEDCNTLDMSQLTQVQLSDFLTVTAKRRKFSMRNLIANIKQFLSHLVSLGTINAVILTSLEVYAPRRRKIYHGFTPEEMEQILSAVDRTTPMGKRDYAMLLLAKHTGLRGIDISRLKVRDITWKKPYEIRIVQSKTQKPLVLPLDVSAGNAIADYILNARPETDEPTLFLKVKQPTAPLAFTNDIVKKYAVISGISQTTKAQIGFHSFRRALGVSMLYAGVDLDMISQVLGHAKRNSTKRYIPLDLKHLTMCAMPMAKYESRKEWVS